MLERANLVRKSRSAQWRTCHLEAGLLEAADDGLKPYRDRDSNPGIENRTVADTCPGCWRGIGGCWRSQFYTEVARPTRFERVTPAFGGRYSIHLSYGRDIKPVEADERLLSPPGPTDFGL